MYQKLKEFLLFSQNPSGFSNLPLQLQNDVQSFATAIIKSDVKNMQESFECLVGLGNGLTPTCDDAMLGVLGVAFGTFENGLLIGGKEQYLKLTNSLICLLLQEHKTTKVSEKYLKCAFRGAFSVDMSNLVKSLFCGEMSLFEHSMKNIADIGHTSGIKCDAEGKTIGGTDIYGTLFPDNNPWDQKYRLIRYKVNKDDKIICIDTINPNVDGSEGINLGYEGLGHRRDDSDPTSAIKTEAFKNNTFAGKTNINRNTKVFLLPTDRNDERKYSLVNSSFFANNEYYSLTTYKMDTSFALLHCSQYSNHNRFKVVPERWSSL